MFRRLGLTISYFIAIVYFLSIVLPSIYCLRHGCRGPGELDAFMPAFGLTPVGAIATAFSLRNAIQQIRKRQSWSWVFWPLAIVFAIVLLGAIAFIAWVIYQTASHR
jgi:Ni/Fe-hydrogenase subunit HybB-like protein